MKSIIIAVFLLALNVAHGQFQKSFNLNFGVPLLRNERFNSGIKTKVNFSAGVPANFFHAEIGTSFVNPALAAPNNIADRMRFTLLDNTGAMRSNKGYQFSTNDAHWLNASGNSIAEIDNGAAGNGGYVAVGAVSNNPSSEAVVAGGSDVLFTQLNAGGILIGAWHLDFDGRRDKATCIRRSRVITSNGDPTWIIAGQSTSVNDNSSDCIVARVKSNGVIIWSKRYNFPAPNGNPAICMAKQLCEDANGNIYVVGTWQAPGVNNIDGLAFKLAQTGVLTWAKMYDVGPDDELTSVRVPNGGNGIVTGGFTKNGAISNMLFVQIDAAGVLGFHNVLKAQDAAGIFYPSECHDVVQTPAGDYFLAGFLIKNGIKVQMMYRASINGNGTNWFSYNQLLYADGFAVDYINGAVPGISFISSIKNQANAAFSDSFIMETDLTGKTCNYCGENMPSTMQVIVQERNPVCNWVNAGTREALNQVTSNYDEHLICNGANPCRSAGVTTSINKAQILNLSIKEGNIKISPNPVSGILHVQFNSLPAGEYQLAILNMQGKVVIQNGGVFNNGTSMMDVNTSSLASGVYFLTLRRDGLVLQQKFVKH